MNGKHLLATLMLLTLFAFWGCMDPSTRDNPYDKQADPIFLKKAKIAGTVVLQDDLEAPGGTQVKVFSDLYTNQVTTDEQGKFSISGITPGDYLLSIERKNFIAIREKLPLGIGEDLDIGKKSLRYKTGSLKGFVLLEDEDGFPEIDNSGVRITFIRTVNAASNSLTAALVSDSSSCTPESKTESQKQFSTTNNPDGSFSMPNLPTGKYEVELVKNSFAPNKSNKQQVDIQEGAPVTLTDLKMKKVTGVVEFARRDEDQSLKRIEVTSTRKVVLLLHSFGNPVKDVVIREQQFEKEDQINDDEWIPYQADVDYEIKSEGDGKKLVYVLYRGFACQKSKIFVASIILDTIKPQITSLGERNNREAINDKQGRVNLEIEAEDNLNMLNQIFISEDEKFTNAIGRDFDLNQTWYLNKDKSGKKISEDKKNIYVKVSDLAGNMSEIASLEIEYDITPPTFKPGFPKVVGGKIEVRTRDIEIELGALKADFFAVGDGDLSCDSLKSNALPESGKTRHILPKVDGDKELTVCIYDRAGNLHGAKLNLKLDQTSPQPDVIKPVELVDSQGKPFAKNIVAKSQLYLLLRASGADFYDIAEDFNFKNNLQSNKYGQNPLKVDYKLSSDKQGVYNLFVRYRDQAGNMSAVSDLSLFLGTPDAKPTMLIDGSNIFCRDERGIVNLSIFVGDNFGAHLMTISENQDDLQKPPYNFQTFKTNFKYMLQGIQGKKTIYARLKSVSGNITDIFSASIEWDAKISKGSCVVNKGVKYTRDSAVKVKVVGDADLSLVRIGETLPMDSLPWQSFDPTKPETDFRLSPQDGKKSIFVSFKDKAGNQIEKGAECSIVLDREKPSSLSLRINGGAIKTNQREVSVFATAEDNIGIDKLLVDSDNTFKDPIEIKMAQSHTVTLPDKKGVKQLFLKAIDFAGNDAVTSAKIEFDPTYVPIAKVVIEEGRYVQSNQVTLLINLPPGAQKLTIRGDLLDNTPLQLAAVTRKEVTLSNTEGLKTLTINFFDGTDKLIESVGVKTVVDLKDPVIVQALVHGKLADGSPSTTSTTSPKVMIEIKANDKIGSGIASYQIAKDMSFVDSTSQPWIDDSQFAYNLPSPGTDGSKLFFVRVIDRSGRFSAPFFLTITLDQTAPKMIWDPKTRVTPGERGLKVALFFSGGTSDIAGFLFQGGSESPFEDRVKTLLSSGVLSTDPSGVQVFELFLQAPWIKPGKLTRLTARAFDQVNNLSAPSPVFFGVPADIDEDGDGIRFSLDNCPTIANANQEDKNGNKIGDDCENICDPGYHEEDKGCVSNIQSCPIINGKGKKVWSDKNEAYGPCQIESCDQYFHVSSDQCQSDLKLCHSGQGYQTWNENDWDPCITCDDDQHVEVTQSQMSCVNNHTICQVANGVGKRIWDSQTSTWSDCITERCNQGFHLEANQSGVQQSCVSDTNFCSIENGQGIALWDSGKEHYGQCKVQFCNRGFHLEFGRCQPSVRICYKNKGFQTWDDAASSWSKCQLCSETQHIGQVSKRCEDNEQSCDMEFGTGQKTWDSQANAWSECEIETCIADYHVENNHCVSNSRECHIIYGVGKQSWSNDQWSECQLVSCLESNSFYPFIQQDGHCKTSVRACPDEPRNLQFYENKKWQECVGPSWKSVSAGHNHVCALNSMDGKWWCMGGNDYGQLGMGNTDRYYWLSTTAKEPAINIGAGFYHSCILNNDGSLYCTGNNSYGQLGVGQVSDQSIFTPLAQTGWLSVEAGGGITCAIKADQTLWCWGNNDMGQLGLNDYRLRDKPAQVGTAKWKKVAPGSYYTCGIQNDGSLWCWGYSSAGALGLAATIETKVPKKVGAGPYKDLDVGDNHSCAIKESGQLFCWGSGGYGQIGFGVEVDKDIPTLLLDDKKWLAISLGEFHSCGIQEDNSLWCWGENGAGQLGDNTQEHRPQPQKIGELTWQSISAGSNFTCGISMPEKGLYCWGTELQVGDIKTNHYIGYAPALTGWGSTYAKIPAGMFNMGSSFESVSQPEIEKPQHQVLITRSFFTSRYEVTNRLWSWAFGHYSEEGNQGSEGDGHSDGNVDGPPCVECEEEDDDGENGPGYYLEGDESELCIEKNCPVKVTFYEALAFANIKSKYYGLEECYTLSDCIGKPGEGMKCAQVTFKGLDCQGYRLPTEAEWEYAARAGEAAELDYNNISQVAWCDGYSSLQKVGGKKANNLLLYDMIGNVSEWVWDLYGPYNDLQLTDPLGPTTGTERILRGGSVIGGSHQCRFAFRHPVNPDAQDNYGYGPVKGGFRLVKSSNEQIMVCDPNTEEIASDNCQADQTCWPTTFGGKCLDALGSKLPGEKCGVAQSLDLWGAQSVVSSDCQAGSICLPNAKAGEHQCFKTCNKTNLNSCATNQTCWPDNLQTPNYGICINQAQCDLFNQDCADKGASHATCYPTSYNNVSLCNDLSKPLSELKSIGQACDANNLGKDGDCQPGLFCSNGICTKYCQAGQTGGCSDPEYNTCNWAVDASGQPTSSYGVCSRICDLKNPGSCGSNGTCYPTSGKMSSANMCVYAPSVEDSLAILPGQACPDPTNDAKACAAGSFCYLGECHSLCDPAQTGNQCGQGFSCIHPYLSNETVSTWGLCGELCHPGKAPFPYSGCLNNKICLFGGSQNEGFCAFPTDALLGQNATCSTEQGGALLPANQRCKDGYICASGKCAKICSRTANYSCKNNQTCSGYPIHDWGVCWQPILEGHQQTGESCLISGGMPEYTCTDTTICHLPAGGNSVCIEPCASNADCEEGEICNENTGLCALDTVTAGCTSDSDCGEGQICSEGECMMSEGPTPECNTDDDCGEGQICQGGECIDEGGSCMDDSDCSTGQVCQDGDCVTGTSSGCTSNADCSTGQICINSGGQGGGQCITGSYTGCASSSECQPGFECAGGYCIDLGGFAM